MSESALHVPDDDPTAIFEIFRGSYGTELLTAAVAHFNVFGLLSQQPLRLGDVRRELKLEHRPAVVLMTALRAMGLVCDNGEQKLALTALAREHLTPGCRFDVGDYVGLAATSPGVLEMVERLRTNRPAGAADEQTGAAFIYRDGIKSAMEHAESARHFTMALAGRAKNVAPVLAERVSLDGATCLLDVGGGTGIYSIALLQRNPSLRAIVLDRPEVLNVAMEMARDYGVADRMQCVAGDMFVDPLPSDCDLVLLSNVLHDWDVPECEILVAHCASVLTDGGRLLIHDVFLNDALDGPLPIALYSAALFTLTEGRAYSAAEYREWLTNAGLAPTEVVSTRIHCGVITGFK